MLPKLSGCFVVSLFQHADPPLPISIFQFVAEHILKSTPSVCEQWRDMRQLPPVSTELPDPAYLFGMHV